MESFYVYLQSDASWDFYPLNNRHNFRNQLAIPINVDASRYEVALAELSYTYNAPYIKRGTKLYTIYNLSRPDVGMIEYDTMNLRIGDGMSRLEEVDLEVLDYAKENHRLLDQAKEILTRDQRPRIKGSVRLVIQSEDILAKNNITTNDALLAELNEQLKPLDILHEHRPSDTDQAILISYLKPEWMTKRVIYSNVINNLFDLDGTETESFTNGAYIIESSFSNDTINIRAGDKIATIEYIKAEINVLPEATEVETPQEHTFATKDLHTLQDLAEDISTSPTTLKVDIINNIATFSVKLRALSRIVLNDRVAGILGINLHDQHIEPGIEYTFQGKQNTSFDLGCRKVYVYTNITEDQRVGDQVAPILRITDYTGVQDRIQIKDFNQFQYAQLRKGNIDSIQVYLKTEIGDDLPLTFGTVSCTLHFREKRF